MSTVSNAADSLTLRLDLYFTESFEGNKIIDGYVVDRSSQRKDFGAKQWNVGTSTNIGPSVSVGPNSGIGREQTFELSVHDPNGSEEARTVYVQFLTPPPFGRTCRIDVFFGRSFRLTSPSLPPPSRNVSGNLDSPNVLDGGLCSLDLTQAEIRREGADMTLTWPMRFSSAFDGMKEIRVSAGDDGTAHQRRYRSGGIWDLGSGRCT